MKKIIVIILMTVGLFTIYAAFGAISTFWASMFFLLIAGMLSTFVCLDSAKLPTEYEEGDEILFRKRSFIPPPPPASNVNDKIYPINHEKLLG